MFWEKHSIENIFSNKTSNTSVGELSNNRQDDPAFTQNVLMTDLPSLSNLVDSNSNCNQIHKRAIVSSRSILPKSSKIEKKADDHICVVCGDQAFGFHYGSITCNSCKVFFSRNAFLPMDKIHCRHGQNKCPVSNHTGRKCTKCRLLRCFTMGMRIDHFSSDKKQQSQQNYAKNSIGQRSLTKTTALSQSDIRYVNEFDSHTLDEINHFVMNMNYDIAEMNDIWSNILSLKDWLDIQSIGSSYRLAFLNESTPKFYGPSDPSSVLSYLSQIRQQTAFSFIAFFRQIHEFEALDEEDRFTLVKYNLFNLLFVHKYAMYNPSTNFFPELPNEVQYQFDLFRLNSRENIELHHKLMNLRYSFATITEQEPIVVYLVIVILLFSTGPLMTEFNARLNNSTAIYQAQSYYARLLWTYLIDKQGERKAIKQYIQTIHLILQMQTCLKQAIHLMRIRFISLNIVHRISPLMQSALGIS